LLQGTDGQRRDRHLHELQAVEAAVVQRVGVIGRLLQVALGERVAVDDQGAVGGQVGDVGLERRRVHRHQHIGSVPRGEDVVVGEVQLEPRYARKGSGGGANLGGKVRQRGEVIADPCGDAGEAVARQLHAVTGVARKADGDGIDTLNRLGAHEQPRCERRCDPRRQL